MRFFQDLEFWMLIGLVFTPVATIGLNKDFLIFYWRTNDS